MINEVQQILAEISDKFQRKEIDRRELEHRLLGAISIEIERNELDRAVWLKAFSDADGDGQKAKALYIKYRLQRILDQILEASLNERARERQLAGMWQGTLREALRKTQNTPAAPVQKHTSNDTRVDGFDYALKTIAVALLVLALPLLAIFFMGMLSASGNSEYTPSGAVESQAAHQFAIATPSSENTVVTFETSYDCSQSSGSVEGWICANADLASQDVAMAALYQDLRDSLSRSERSNLESDQRAWIAHRNACSNLACVTQAYVERLRYLRRAARQDDAAQWAEGSPAPPIISQEWSPLRSRIIDAWTTSPGFAGRYVIIRVGCGTGCSTNIVGDHQTGRLFDLGLGGEAMQMLQLQYSNSSSNLTAQWEDFEADNCVRQSFIWDGRMLQPSSLPTSTPIQAGCAPLI